MTRVCMKCGNEKPIELFKRSGASRANVCVPCDAARARAEYWADIQKSRQKRREKYYANIDREREGMRLRSRKAFQENPAPLRAIQKTPKAAARKALRDAVRRGAVIRPSLCSECGDAGTIHAHHTDYSQPLMVQWLCAFCHGKQHRKSAEVANV